MSGIGGFGEVAQGPDGGLYQWVEGIDGLGNPIGFWRRLRRLGRGLLKTAQRVAPLVPGIGPAAAAAITAATPYLQRAGLVGMDGLGALYQAPDGAVYRMEGVGAEDALDGYLADDELQGFAADDDLDGLDEDDELTGADVELQGVSDDAELRAVDESEDVSGVDADEDLSGFDEGEDLQGLDQGYVREDGVHGVDAYVPQQAPATRWFSEPGYPPPLWKPLW